ncbi:Hypp2092 [Branchiostoma lanceolatum]|uniref:Hypp2092 protein n=1 Tax=Branchiostoma lanceolatum TaxID=7740 RepID=A0A8J9ZNU4_BRALA|nr:Hypp2092 [Branchiostoma lanceolatum]
MLGCPKLRCWKQRAPDALLFLTAISSRCRWRFCGENTVPNAAEFPTGNIQFTYEEEQNGTLPFLDTLLVRKEDGTVKLLVYRKTTNTDQYLNFQSHHPLHQKLGVIRTLLDRCNAVVTEEQDKQLETQHVKRALSRCGYPQWTFKKVEQQRSRPKQKGKSKKQEEKARAMVVIPYIKGVTEPLERVFRKHNVSTAVRPKTTLRSLLVHPKDKLDDLVKTDCVYKIPCKSCNEVYIGETGRTFGTRLDEHKKEADSIEVVKYTRSQKRQAQQVDKKSAITDHIARHNCIIDWEGAKVIDREDNRRTRWIKEAVWIRKTAPVMNRDEGAYKLSRIWDSVLTAKAPPTSATYSGEKQHSSQKL